MARFVKTFRVPAMLKTASLDCERKATCETRATRKDSCGTRWKTPEGPAPPQGGNAYGPGGKDSEAPAERRSAREEKPESSAEHQFGKVKSGFTPGQEKTLKGRNARRVAAAGRFRFPAVRTPGGDQSSEVAGCACA
jgi:hypothetical protein